MCSAQKVGAVSSSSRAVALGVYPELRSTPTRRDDRVSQFPPGTGLRVESDVTLSKQTTAAFLPGTRIAQCGLRQGTAACPDLRRAAVPSLVRPDKERDAQCRYSFRVNPGG